MVTDTITFTKPKHVFAIIYTVPLFSISEHLAARNVKSHISENIQGTNFAFH
jgi:hypothetical protein